MCAQHGRELMGWKSPVGVPTWTQGEQEQPQAKGKGETAWDCPKEAGMQEVRVDGLQTASSRLRDAVGDGRSQVADGSKAHWYAADGKCGACAPTVRASTWGDLRSLAVWC